ncbi:hypothetical protein AVEN_149068-1 [Araneus ventricosus]|uniref:Uncharacterized protein n=1 Tax=Araneus ventricosus TaxID=182803 RepID=A0A4Y2ULC0_ARAVE|nr:hypothetical protein AVEN_149068-1 [Araneus ventricosus]
MVIKAVWIRYGSFRNWLIILGIFSSNKTEHPLRLGAHYPFRVVESIKITIVTPIPPVCLHRGHVGYYCCFYSSNDTYSGTRDEVSRNQEEEAPTTHTPGPGVRCPVIKKKKLQRHKSASVHQALLGHSRSSIFQR